MKTTAERFWPKVDKSTECWVWTAARFSTGLPYGMFQLGGRPHGAHRVAWFLIHGRWPQHQIAHRCDNPPCVRPSHLFEASPLENNRDMIRKRRNKTNGKLTDEQCLEVRRLVAEGPRGTARSLARRYGVSEGMISMIVHSDRRTRQD